MAVGLAASLQVAAVIPNLVRVEFFHRFVEPSKLFSDYAFRLDDDGCIPLGDYSGIGISVDESVLQSFDYPRILSWTRLSVRFLGSVAPTRKARIVILRKAFAVKPMSLKNVQSNA